jgi:hypothetical protein
MSRVERQTPRYLTKLAVTNINGLPVTDSFLLDVSATGAKLESPTPLAPRFPIEVVVLLPGDQTETNLAGMVIWTRPSMASPGRHLMGLEFHHRFWYIDQLGRAGKI